MENNTPPQPSQQAQTPQTPAAPTTTETAPATPEHKSRFGLLFGILVALGIVFLGGTYYVISTQKPSQTPITNKEVETQTDIHKLDEELQSLEQQNIESDFTEVDQELKNL